MPPRPHEPDPRELDLRLHRQRRPADVLRERVELPHDATGPSLARAVVVGCAVRSGLAALADDLAVLVSELVTNAVLHADAPLVLEVEARGATVVVAVADASPVPPCAREAGADAEGGRGMLLLDLLASAHGVRCEAAGKTVWAAVTLPDARP